jgi:hypothetical protein
MMQTFEAIYYSFIRKIVSVERRTIISSHNRRPMLFIPSHPTTHPLDRLLNTSTSESTTRQDTTIPNAGAPLALKHLPHKQLLYANDLDAILAILLVRQHQQRDALGIGMLQHILEHQPTLAEPAVVVAVVVQPPAGGHVGGNVGVAHVAAVDDENDGVAGGVVALPQPAQRVLAAHVPDLEVHVGQGYDGEVLADGGDGVELWVGVGRV